MKYINIKLACLVVAMALTCMPMAGICAEAQQSITAKFQPGSGNPIGTVLNADGQAIISHAEADAVYKVKKGLALYTGDTLTTMGNGRVVLKLNDDSQITLGQGATLVLNESVFDPLTKKRSGLVNLVRGKARFLVKKFADFQFSTFNVKAVTSVAAVRGSEFIVDIRADGTVIITCGGDTILEVTTEVTLPGGQQSSVTKFVGSFEQFVASWNALPDAPFQITPEMYQQALENMGGGEGDGEGGDGAGLGNRWGQGGGDDVPVSPSGFEKD